MLLVTEKAIYSRILSCFLIKKIKFRWGWYKVFLMCVEKGTCFELQRLIQTIDVVM